MAPLVMLAAALVSYTLSPTVRPDLCVRASPPPQLCATEPSAKVTIRPPSSSSDSDGSGSSSSVKVKVKVRAPSERAASAAPAVVAPAELDESATTTKITVKAPAKVAAPPAPPKGPALSPAEEDLLEATQRANCTKVLAALQAGANPNVRDPKGRTPLHFMAGVGLAPAAALLIHFGAQVDARDFDDLTPLHMAAGYANSQTLRVLVVAGADTTLKGKAQGTPFEVVCSLGDYQLKQVYDERSKPQNRFKRKDEKLEELKKCLDVLDDPEALRAEESWDELMQDVLRAIASNDAEVVQEAAA